MSLNPPFVVRWGEMVKEVMVGDEEAKKRVGLGLKRITTDAEVSYVLERVRA